MCKSIYMVKCWNEKQTLYKWAFLSRPAGNFIWQIPADMASCLIAVCNLINCFKQYHYSYFFLLLVNVYCHDDHEWVILMVLVMVIYKFTNYLYMTICNLIFFINGKRLHEKIKHIKYVKPGIKKSCSVRMVSWWSYKLL